MLNRFHAWYDTVKEPYRFLIFISSMILWLAPVELGVLIASPTLMIIGMIGMTVVVFVALHRIGYLNRK